jgi:hypothetical protein
MCGGLGHVAAVAGRADAPALAGERHHERLAAAGAQEKWVEEYEKWSRRDLSGEEYVYVWADGIHVNVPLEDEGNPKQCEVDPNCWTVGGPV